MKITFKELNLWITDYWHLFLGMLTIIVLNFFPPASLFIALVYFIYQALEKEATIQTVKDLAVYLFGCLFGFILSYLMPI